MKHLLAVLMIAFAGTVFAEPQTKEICKDKKNANGQVVKGKDGKPVQVCKTIKIHKKHEGTKVPPK